MEKYITCEGQLTKPEGIQLYFKKDLPQDQRAIFIFVHGLCEHLGRYDDLTKTFNELGYGVYRFDNRGHGKSGGERGYVEDFMHFIEDTDIIVDMVQKENPDTPIFMLGHSMGGYIAAAYGIQYPDKLKGQVFSGPATILLPIFEDLKQTDFDAEPHKKVPNSLSSVICRDPEVVRAYEQDPLVLKETNQKLLGEVFVKGPQWLEENIKKYIYPCLILHGDDDRIVIPEASQWLYKSISSKDKSLKLYKAFFHEILNEKEKDRVVSDIHKWVEERL